MTEEFNNDIDTIKTLFDNIKMANNYEAAPKLYSLCSKTYQKYENVKDIHIVECLKNFLTLVIQILFFIQYTNTYQNNNGLEKNGRVKKLEPKT